MFGCFGEEEFKIIEKVVVEKEDREELLWN